MNLLAPKPIRSFTPEEYITYVKSLYVKPEVKKPYSYRLSPKGNPVVLCKREPKYITHSEFDEIASELNVKKNILFLYLKKRSIAVRDSALRVTSKGKKL